MLLTAAENGRRFVNDPERERHVTQVHTPSWNITMYSDTPCQSPQKSLTPELASDHDTDIESWGTDSDSEAAASFSFDMVVSRFADALSSYPLEKWIHQRFCSVYEVHHFAHDRFVRALLFGFSTARQRLPELEEATLMMFIGRRLRKKWPDDTLDIIATMVFGQGMLDWVAREKHHSPWIISPAELSINQRAMMLIFSDPCKVSADGLPDRWQTPSVAFGDIHRFLIEPQILCPNAPDIMSLPLVGQVLPSHINHIPSPNPNTCICGECVTVYGQLEGDTYSFRTKYFDLLQAAEVRDNCPALSEAWEPMVAKAEEWVDSLMGRFQSSYGLFPSSIDFRLGPLILDVANVLNTALGAQLDTRDTLRLVTLLHSESTRPGERLVPPPRLPPDALGYFHRVDESSEQGDFFAKIGSDAIVLSVGGGWLYDLPADRLDDSNGAISFLYPSEEVKISYQSSKPSRLACLCMPSAQSDMPKYLPGVHDDNETRQMLPTIPSQPPVFHLEIHLSNLRNHLFPLLSVLSEHRKLYPHGFVAAQLSITVAGHLLQTSWKPDVTFGRTCQHTEDHKRTMRCSLTSWEIISQVPPPRVTWTQFLAACKANYFMTPDDARDNLNRYLDEQKKSYAHLTEQSGPFERHRLSIVRCGVVEGPPDPIVLIAGGLGKKVYVIHAQECWHCACARMLRSGCTVAIAVDPKVHSKCGSCITAEDRAKQIAEMIKQEGCDG